MPEVLPTAFSGPHNASDPARDAKVVTPDNAVNLPDGVCSSLWIGSVGHVKVTTRKGTDVTFSNVASGTLLRIQAQRVWATGTTASNIVALY